MFNDYNWPSLCDDYNDYNYNRLMLVINFVIPPGCFTFLKASVRLFISQLFISHDANDITARVGRVKLTT